MHILIAFIAAGSDGRSTANQEDGEVFDDEMPKSSRQSSPSPYPPPSRRPHEFGRDYHDRYPEVDTPPRYREDRYRGPAYGSHYPPAPYEPLRHGPYPRWKRRSPSVSSADSRYHSRSRSRSRSLGRDYADRMRGLHVWDRDRSRDRERERDRDRERDRERQWEWERGGDPRGRDYRPSIDERRGRERRPPSPEPQPCLIISKNSLPFKKGVLEELRKTFYPFECSDVRQLDNYCVNDEAMLTPILRYVTIPMTGLLLLLRKRLPKKPSGLQTSNSCWSIPWRSI